MHGGPCCLNSVNVVQDSILRLPSSIRITYQALFSGELQYYERQPNKEMTMESLSTDDLAVFAAMQSFIDEYAALLDDAADVSAASSAPCTDTSAGEAKAIKKNTRVARKPPGNDKSRASKRQTDKSPRSSDCASPLAGHTSPSVASSSPSTVEADRLEVRKPRVKYNYNPNRARDDERKELIDLRDQADDLAQELEALEEVRRTCAQCHGRRRGGKRRGDKRSRADGKDAVAHESVELPRDRARTAEVWKEIANDQFQQHMRAVRENRRLKRVVEGHREITDDLKRLLEHRTASEVRHNTCDARSVRQRLTLCVVY